MVMSLSDWTEGEVEACNSEIVDCYESFQNENKRPFDHKHDYQTTIGQRIAEAEERRSQLESVLEEDEEVATPLRYRINTIKPDLVFLKKIAKNHANYFQIFWRL
jgi:hypothetical protein